MSILSGVDALDPAKAPELEAHLAKQVRGNGVGASLSSPIDAPPAFSPRLPSLSLSLTPPRPHDHPPFR